MPGLRENLMERLSREIVIDSEFAALIPPLTDDELKRLEQSIIAEGCRDALVLWGNILIDGHNRYKICMKHNIEFRTIQREFKDRDEVLLWIMQNQLSRRNLSDFQRVELVRKCEDAVKTQAKARQKATQFGGGDKFTTTVEKSRDTLGKMAGVSGSTYEHAAVVLDKAPEPVIEATRRKELSINAAYGVTKLPKSQQAEIAERIAEGGNPRYVIADTKHKNKTRSNNSYQQIPTELFEAVHSLIENLHSQHSQELLHILSEIKSAKENDDRKSCALWFGNFLSLASIADCITVAQPIARFILSWIGL